MYGLCSKLECLSKLVLVTDYRKDTIWLSVNYESELFYRTGLWSNIFRQGQKLTPEGSTWKLLNLGRLQTNLQILDLAGKACHGQAL
jgi:hypothetical protein